LGFAEDEDSETDAEAKKLKLNKDDLYTLIHRIMEEVNV